MNHEAREKEEKDHQTESYDLHPLNDGDVYSQGNKKTLRKCSITQRLRTDLGRSVGRNIHPTSVVNIRFIDPTFQVLKLYSPVLCYKLLDVITIVTVAIIATIAAIITIITSVTGGHWSVM